MRDWSLSIKVNGNNYFMLVKRKKNFEDHNFFKKTIWVHEE